MSKTEITYRLTNYKNSYAGKYWNGGLNDEKLSENNWGKTNSKIGTGNRYGDAFQCYVFSLFMANVLFGKRIIYGNVKNAENGTDLGDDVINVHGMYTKADAIDSETIFADIAHNEQRYFLPYESGDRLEIIDDKTLEIVAEFVVESAAVISDDGSKIKINGHFTNGQAANVKKNFLIEIPDKMPDTHIHNNSFSRFPNLRASGAGKIVIENNAVCNATSAILALDLAKYWYESGRIRELAFRNNIIEN